MTAVIDWFSFVQVFGAALLAAVVVVASYAAGLRLLVRAGRPPVVTPAEFTDAITVITDKQRERAAKAAAKATRKSPLSEAQKRVSLAGAYASFALCALAVATGILLIILGR